VKEQLEQFEFWATEVIFGRIKGLRARLLCFFLRGVSWIFYLGVKIRLYVYRHRIKPSQSAGVLTISVGNITAGGTGKTPVVEMLAKQLRAQGKRVAILSRGYKSHALKKPQTAWLEKTGLTEDELPKIVSDGKEIYLGPKYAGDEPYMLAKNLDNVAVLVDKKRTKAAQFAIKYLQADVLLLDDGLQYLDLHHDFDVVLIDANYPYGTGFMLPRGTLREPPPHLCRATHILVTKSGGVVHEDLNTELSKHNPCATLMTSSHHEQYLQEVHGDKRLPLSYLKGKHVIAVSGIAYPKSFEDKLEKLGADLIATRRFIDHHEYHLKEVNKIAQLAADQGADAIIMTEKDAVKFPKPSHLDIPLYYLRIEIDVFDGQEELQQWVESL